MGAEEKNTRVPSMGKAARRRASGQEAQRFGRTHEPSPGHLTFITSLHHLMLEVYAVFGLYQRNEQASLYDTSLHYASSSIYPHMSYSLYLH